MTISSKHLIETQIPLHIRESSPLFVKFLEYYYEFQEEQKIKSIIQDVLQYGDIDVVEESFLKQLFEELHILPNEISANRRLIAKHIYDLYQTKGTYEGLRLLLKIITDVDIVIKEPYSNVLKASDGIWRQENFITVKIKTGVLPKTFKTFTLVQNTVSRVLNVTKIETIDSTSFRFYYTSSISVVPAISNLVYVYENNELVFIGSVEKSPARIEIESAGKGWSVGQVIVFPGPKSNTLCKVAKVNSEGGLLRVDVIDYGLGHAENSTLETSPYGARPINARYTIDIVTTSPNVRTHTLKIYDGIAGASESITGDQIGISQQSYFLSSYNVVDYNANTVIDVSTSIESPQVDSSITIEQWLESKATLVLKFDAYAKMLGKWVTDNGQLSNPYSVLQDSKYYQIYSYVISSSANPATYKESVKVMHPAGAAMYMNQDIQDILIHNSQGTTGITVT